MYEKKKLYLAINKKNELKKTVESWPCYPLKMVRWYRDNVAILIV